MSNMDEKGGIGLADAERIMELNLGQITEKLLQISTLSCSSTSGNMHSTLCDEAAPSFNNAHSNFRYINN